MWCCCHVDMDTWQIQVDRVNRWAGRWFDRHYHSPASSVRPRTWPCPHRGQGWAAVPAAMIQLKSIDSYSYSVSYWSVEIICSQIQLEKDVLTQKNCYFYSVYLSQNAGLEKICFVFFLQPFLSFSYRQCRWDCQIIMKRMMTLVHSGDREKCYCLGHLWQRPDVTVLLVNYRYMTVLYIHITVPQQQFFW